MDTPSGLHGAHRRGEALAALGDRRLRTAIKSGVLRPLWTNVVVDGSRFLDPLTRGAAALLVAGDDAALSGPTAAWLHGCRAVEDAAVHITVRPGRTLKQRPGLVVHHRGMFSRDVVDVLGLRVLALDRVLSDLLCSVRAQDGLALADEALRNAGAEPEQLRSAIATQIGSRLDPRGTVRAALLLDLASPRSRSPAESWLRWGLVDAGFPIPEVNWPVTGPDGTVHYLVDLAWPSLRIAVEHDGYAAHVGREEADRLREIDLCKRGWIVIRSRAADLGDLGRLLRELRAAFAARGYTW
ncbi:DUF559 domain-containing protein [Pseudonocardia sp. CA-107938]|uniref:DUF559 domain-containing protein n=1 Tax=Pseudonocardia sp. CA-107938 TaxID=3240021 RepID=UPI003D8CFDAE